MWKSHLSYKLWEIRARRNKKEKLQTPDTSRSKLDAIFSPAPRKSKFTDSHLEDSEVENEETVTPISPFQNEHVSPEPINKTRLTPIPSREASTT